MTTKLVNPSTIKEGDTIQLFSIDSKYIFKVLESIPDKNFKNCQNVVVNHENKNTTLYLNNSVKVFLVD